jgi:hypothetical protein
MPTTLVVGDAGAHDSHTQAYLAEPSHAEKRPADVPETGLLVLGMTPIGFTVLDQAAW